MTIMGCDPHPDTFDIAVLDPIGVEQEHAHLPNSAAGWSQAVSIAKRHRVEQAGIEAASGYGRHIAVALNHAGISVLEIPTRLTARLRLRDGAAKTDPGDARAFARCVAAGEGNTWTNNDTDETVRVLVHHRNAQVRTQTREINQLRALIAEIDPTLASGLGRIRTTKTLHQLHHVDYQDSQHRQTVAALIRQLAHAYIQRHHHINQLKHQIEQALPERAYRLINTITGEMAGTDGFATDSKMAAWAGTAPLDASSGRQQRHRLNRGGNRQANWAIHIIALTQTRWPGPAHDYITRRQTEGLTRKEALRALKRHITRTIWKTLQLTKESPRGCVRGRC